MGIAKVDLPCKQLDVFSCAAWSLKTPATKRVENACVTSGGSFPFNLLHQGGIVSCPEIWVLHLNDVLIGSFRLLFAHTRNAGCRVPVIDFSHQKLADHQITNSTLALILLRSQDSSLPAFFPVWLDRGSDISVISLAEWHGCVIRH